MTWINAPLGAILAAGSLALSACVTTPQTELTQAAREAAQEGVDTFFVELDKRLGKHEPAMLWPLSEGYRFGYWATVGDEQLFTAFLEDASIYSDCVSLKGDECIGFWFAEVWGERSGINPVSGSAVWSGHTLVGTPGSEFAPSEGSILLHANFDRAYISAYFTDTGPERWDRSYLFVPMTDGTFGTNDGWQIEGAFYGSRHEGVAGTFQPGGLVGIFGAVRE